MEVITVNDRLEKIAEKGDFEATLFVWKSAAKKLEREGLLLTDIPAPRTLAKGQRYCRISWQHAIVQNLPKDWELTKVLGSRPLCQAQVLWLMAANAKRN